MSYYLECLPCFCARCHVFFVACTAHWNCSQNSRATTNCIGGIALHRSWQSEIYLQFILLLLFECSFSNALLRLVLQAKVLVEANAKQSLDQIGDTQAHTGEQQMHMCICYNLYAIIDMMSSNKCLHVWTSTEIIIITFAETVKYIR